MACENDVIQLVCNPYSRVAIYSASFGRTEHESLQCSQSTGTREESKCMRILIIKSNGTTFFYGKNIFFFLFFTYIHATKKIVTNN